MHWRIWLHPTEAQPHAYVDFPAPEGPINLNATDNPQVYPLLCSQLRAAGEKLASALSKTIMNDLERRLERREKCRGFETCLIGVILLSCVEKMSWYFKTFDDVRWSSEVRD